MLRNLGPKFLSMPIPPFLPAAGASTGCIFILVGLFSKNFPSWFLPLGIVFLTVSVILNGYTILSSQQTAINRIRDILESTTDGVFTVDHNWRFTYINGHAEPFFKPREQILGKHLWAEFPDSKDNIFHRNYAEVMKRQHPMHFVEYSDVLKCWFEVHAYPNAGGISVFFRDVTARKIAEEQLKESKERLAIALKAAELATWNYDIATHTISWDHTLGEGFFPPSSQGSTGEKNSSNLLFHAIQEILMKEIPDKLMDKSEFELEVNLSKEARAPRWMALRGKTVFDEDANPVRVTGVAMDITQGKQASELLLNVNAVLEEKVLERTAALQAAQEKLLRSERMASIGTFATGIAHEINNPINSILLSAQYAMERLPPNSDHSYAKTLAAICGEAKRCGRIVKNVLRFAKHESTNKWVCGLNELVSKAATLAKTYTNRSDFNLELSLAKKELFIQANPTEIEQVLINLIQNAVEAYPKDEKEELKITIKTKGEGEKAVLTVCDNGPGISKVVIPFIFDPFYSTKRSQGGTGLGLSIVHGIITDHQGLIDVQSGNGDGCIFNIILPAVDVTAEAHANLA